ncbi:MAG: M48 family metalloprotease [Chitinophagaceae bacterium]|nr:M48 family metalloprotease [Chitinophagaceae bacterium]
MLRVRTVTLSLILFAFHLSCIAQLQSAYTFQKDDTILRRKYADQSVKKKEILLASVEKQYAKDYKDIYGQQFESIGELWNSTRPVTSPEAHDYLQSIIQKIITVNPELKGTDARVVFSRDWWPNAVSMGDGTIAINAGLLVHLDNEAELVFVVCHEMAHYYLEHTQKAIKKYVEAINSAEYQAELKRLSKQKYGANKDVEKLAMSTIFHSRRHSRENEADADKQAYLFMKRTGYDCGAIIATLELLDKVDDSLFHKPINVEQAFHFTGYPFRKKWIQKESFIFSQVDDNSSLTKKEKDSLKTHPDCSRRISLLTDSVNSLAGTGKKFIVNEDLFKKLKQDFLVELAEECYRGNEWSRNLYYHLIFLQEGKNRRLAIYSIARCLNGLYEKQKEHKFGTAVDTENKGYPADYNLLLRMLGRLRLDEIASLSYYFCRQYETEMQGDEHFRKEMTKAAGLKEQ